MDFQLFFEPDGSLTIRNLATLAAVTIPRDVLPWLCESLAVRSRMCPMCGSRIDDDSTVQPAAAAENG